MHCIHELLVHDSIDDRMANVVAYEESVLAWGREYVKGFASLHAPRSNGPMNKASTPSTAAIPSTASRASFVSIWIIVTSVSFACWRYSVRVGMGLNLSMASSDPKPRSPAGGNLAARTICFASSTVLTRGTRSSKVSAKSLWKVGDGTYSVGTRIKRT